jgi:hypothetical protein
MSTLAIARGELPLNRPFEATSEEWNRSGFIMVPSKSEHLSGNVVIDYPFSQPYASLSADTPEFSDLAVLVRERIELNIDQISSVAESVGVSRDDTYWALTELLTNATQYGRPSEESSRAVLVRLTWEFGSDQNGPYVALAVANPCYRLFDPAFYPQLSVDEFSDLPPSNTNGHLGTIALLGKLREGAVLTYVWNGVDGSMIRLGLSPMQEVSDEMAQKDLMAPVSISAEKFSPSHNPLRYSYQDFLRDMSARVPVESLTIACVIGAKRRVVDED